MKTVDLGGEWRLVQAGSREILPGRAPGCVHTDLLAAGLIEDPYYRDNEIALKWIGETDWTYSREFDVPAELLGHDSVLLRAEMLDTLATVTVNGRPAGKADNMFRTWEFDVKNLLRPGRNEISIEFASAVRYCQDIMKKHSKQPEWSRPTLGRYHIRKEQCNFGWDWGPMLVTAGIQRPISIVAFDTARLREPKVTQKHSKKAVQLTVDVEAEVVSKKASLKAEVSLTRNGAKVASAKVALRSGAGKAKLKVSNPELWWPAGMGAQPLYDLTIDLIDAEGRRLDSRARRIGLRTLVLERRKDKWGQSFQFKANGIAFFSKGANWIPADTFQSRVRREDFLRLLTDARDANMNMIRVWGGGVYEEDSFYDICDELGLCVWQDFMYACAQYPFDRPGFTENCIAEAEENVARLRNHPCIALWCGNNELEQFDIFQKTGDRRIRANYVRFFDKLLPAAVAKADPDRDYWPGSPHTPPELGDRAVHSDPRFGDAHLWDVWHGRKPYEWYRTTEHRFVSEFGFQSFPEPATTASYTAPEDRNVTSFVMEHHQRSGIGNTVIMQYMLDWLRMPLGFENTLWCSQILQALAIRYAVEHWRRNTPRTMGALYWQLNDCWPVASWASIDSLGRWKALHYEAKRFFAPLAVSGVEDVERRAVDIHVASDLFETAEAEVAWSATDLDGVALEEGRLPVKVAAGKSIKVETLRLEETLAAHGLRRVLVWLELLRGGEVVSRAMVHFAKPKHLDLRKPEIASEISEADGGYAVTLRVRHPALWVWLECEGEVANFSDSFFHMRPGLPVTVEVRPREGMSKAEFESKLRVRSLRDTY